MKTVLITGCSSGFGLEIARYFLARDWQVVATMRTPRADVLPPSERLRVLPPTSQIRKASARLSRRPARSTCSSTTRASARLRLRN
jgi:NAD(P)-dependent dehydrogenase (short-subunit alcohol dehydrogenase family)